MQSAKGKAAFKITVHCHCKIINASPVDFVSCGSTCNLLEEQKELKDILITGASFFIQAETGNLSNYPLLYYEFKKLTLL